MSGPTREEVERLVSDCTIAAKVLKSAKEFETGQAILCDAATMLQALRERLEAAEARSYALAVAIMGGEDAPGYADSVPTQVLVDQQRKMAAGWVHAVPADEARATIAQEATND